MTLTARPKLRSSLKRSWGRETTFSRFRSTGSKLSNESGSRWSSFRSKTGVPLVATNDAHYLMPEDSRAHDVLLCIGSGKTVNDTNRLRYRQPQLLCALAGGNVAHLWQRTPRSVDPHCRDRRKMRSPAARGRQSSSQLPDPRRRRICPPTTISKKLSGRALSVADNSVWDRQHARSELRHADVRLSDSSGQRDCR